MTHYSTEIAHLHLAILLDITIQKSIENMKDRALGNFLNSQLVTFDTCTLRLSHARFSAFVHVPYPDRSALWVSPEWASSWAPSGSSERIPTCLAPSHYASSPLPWDPEIQSFIHISIRRLFLINFLLRMKITKRKNIKVLVFKQARKAIWVFYSLATIHFTAQFLQSKHFSDNILKILTLVPIFYFPLISYLSLTQRNRRKLLWKSHFLGELVEIGGGICSSRQNEYKRCGWWRVLEHQTQIRSLSNKDTRYNTQK